MITEEFFKGVFITDVAIIQQKLQQVKAFIFDWDGVFNDGRKDIQGNSGFSEIDSMGINMMRFSYYQMQIYLCRFLLHFIETKIYST